MRGCVPNLETPVERTKKLRYKLMKYVFIRVRAAYHGHPVTDYTRASSGLAELKQRKQGDLAFLAGSHTD